MTKKVVIIGGGIAGLSAGIYALRSGFDVTILEGHSKAGGNCTSWRRGGYLFEGGMHWLTGSNPNEPLNKLWRTVGALDDQVVIHYPEPYFTLDYQGMPISLFRNVDKTEHHLIAISPEDEKVIRELCKSVRKVQGLTLPVIDLKGVRTTNKQSMPLSMIFTGISMLSLMNSLSKTPQSEYINRFKHAGIRDLLYSNSNAESGMLPLIFTLGVLTRGDGGFPEGGSLPFVERIVNTYLAGGGELLLRSRADQVIIENNQAVGVSFGDRQLPCDAVIVTADTMAVNSLFEQPLQADWLDTMQNSTKPTMVTLVSLGVNADLSQYPRGYVFKPQNPIRLADQEYQCLSVNNYSGDQFYSPPGKTALTIHLGGDTYDFWKQAKQNGSYLEAKEKIAAAVIQALATQIPEVDGKVEVIDVATPLTYERYLGNWRGSWMTEMTSGMKMQNYPAVIEGLAGLYFAGQRMQPPGGLPVALLSGRTAVQYLCRDTDTMFVSD
ncbi:MAG: NAD(P)/FAD-dependent oxidoreductase [Coriobacteriales bacterium]|jgi:phytoene dehydrogenase-like protein|nr:NAD(P)/FAD-dependent oxidoreductase [Coriobacteriales bacterium]